MKIVRDTIRHPTVIKNNLEYSEILHADKFDISLVKCIKHLGI